MSAVTCPGCGHVESYIRATRELPDGSIQYMENLILQTGKVVHHRNGNTLDNTRDNLFPCPAGMESYDWPGPEPFIPESHEVAAHALAVDPHFRATVDDLKARLARGEDI